MATTVTTLSIGLFAVIAQNSRFTNSCFDIATHGERKGEEWERRERGEREKRGRGEEGVRERQDRGREWERERKRGVEKASQVFIDPFSMAFLLSH